MPTRKKSRKFSKIVSFFWPPCCGRGVRRENLTCSLTNEYPFAKTSVPVLCGSTSRSSWCAMIRFAESDRTCCKCRVAPDMAMTTGMTMVLPSSHSPAMQDHAMGAALSERQGGETPVRQNTLAAAHISDPAFLPARGIFAAGGVHDTQRRRRVPDCS